MTDEIFRGFLRLKELFGQEEAVSGLAIEHHTVSHILSILRENHSEAHVDLVQGGRTILLFTEEDSDSFKRDFLAARAAGVNVDHVEWLSQDEVQQASFLVVYQTKREVTLISGNRRHTARPILPSAFPVTISGP